MNDRRLEFRLRIPNTSSIADRSRPAYGQFNPRHSAAEPSRALPNVRLFVRLVLVVEADSAVLTKIVCVSGFGGIATFETIGSAARHHLTLSIKDQIDLFRYLMMMRKVCA